MKLENVEVLTAVTAVTALVLTTSENVLLASACIYCSRRSEH
ncbi:MAG TPA: hypothetical protein VE130_12695 [Nitrososphaeraceae archaeon]|nr:hypothetical protein [Nitrososphaeraceae archaeon]